MNKKIVFVDICDTLYPYNTTIGFIMFVCEIKNIRISCVYKNKIIKGINSLLYKLFKVDLIRKVFVRKLKGIRLKELDILAKEYVNKLNENKSIILLVNKYKSEGYEIQFHSASLEPVVSAVSEKFKASKYSASLLSSVQGICSGKIIFDNLGNKYSSILEEKNKAERCVFITDNKSDSNCVEICDEFIAIIPKGKSKKFWENKNVKVIKL
ncbi:hypothetical protein [Photobacterium carnosum]|uniref:hypothetical protein n=1 Tax=Photobacterium carnosum TaxID=2023717 RepID=UPI002431BCF0|nr:hypothetical protein [Photobacterium carnosum]